MRQLKRTTTFLQRLAKALRRNGLVNVWRFASNMSRRHGVRQTLAYALATPARQREKLVELERAAQAPAAPSVKIVDDAPERLDAAFTTTFRLWQDRLEKVELSLRRNALTVFSTAEHRHGPSVGLLVDGLDPKAVRDTGQAYGGPWAPSADETAAADLIASLAGDDWLAVLKAGDWPDPALQSAIADAAVRHGPVDVLSFDLTGVCRNMRILPILLPGANAWAARYTDIGFGRYAFRAGALRQGGDGYERLQAWLAERPFSDARDRWRHLTKPLARIKVGADELASVRSSARRRGEAECMAGCNGPERVSIVICTHERGHLLRRLINSVELESPRIAELVVVANNVRDSTALETLDWIRSLSKTRVLVRDEPFNFSKFSNAGAALATGDRLLFLNDDILPLSDDWLTPLLVPLRDPSVGISGSLLLYPNERVQHAGIFLGFRGGAGHTLRHARLTDGDYLTYASSPREVSAVTGAAMMVRTDVFKVLNGFDEFLSTYLQDVDLCMRAAAAGFSTIFTPLSLLLHMESITMLSADGALEQLSEQRGREREHFLRRWPMAVLTSDPFHNASFDLEDETLHSLTTPEVAGKTLTRS